MKHRRYKSGQVACVGALGTTPPVFETGDADTEEPFELAPDPVKAFFNQVPSHLLELRKLVQELGQKPEEAARQKTLSELYEQVCTLKGIAGLAELRPVWQVASASEWLLKQLVDRSEKVNPSALRTVANGVDLLVDLCKPGVRADLCTNPPVRFLAVDDDSISRHAIAFSLKKGFNQPDVASNGEAALALASAIAYDVIFLDIQMPGMDGFDLCSKIRQTSLNRITPVIFVTCRSDFDARAKSSLCGGNDLLGKPFLTFEVTLKALTFALHARLRRANESAKPANESPAPAAVSPLGEQTETVPQGGV